MIFKIAIVATVGNLVVIVEDVVIDIKNLKFPRRRNLMISWTHTWPIVPSRAKTYRKP